MSCPPASGWSRTGSRNFALRCLYNVRLRSFRRPSYPKGASRIKTAASFAFYDARIPARVALGPGGL